MKIWISTFTFIAIGTSGLATAQVDFSTPEDRLNKLSVENLAGYRDLAEELSVIQHDTARNLSIRLYLIAAKLSDGPLRRSCLRGLVDVARNEKERDRFRVLGFLNDPVFANWLKRQPTPDQEETTTKATRKAATTPKERLLDALLSIRQGKSLRARKIMEEPEVQKLFAGFKDQMTLAAFNQACIDPELTDQNLASILKIDLELRFGKIPETAVNQQTVWNSLFKGQLPERLPRITFDSVTEFDPDQSLYRNGVWQKPPK